MTSDQADDLAAFRIDGALGFWEIAAARPQRPAVIADDGGRTTFGELRAWSDRIAAGLLELGLAPDDTVAVVLSNEPAFLAVQLATSQLGLYLTPVNWHLTAAEAGYILRDSEARVLVADARFAATAAEAADLAGIPADRRFAATQVAGWRHLDELAGLSPLPCPPPDRRLMGATMLYTSGTTGHPKGVRKRRRTATPEQALARSLPLGSRRYGTVPGDGAHLVVAPLYHAAPNGFATSSLHLGQTVVLMQKWQPERTLQLIQEHRITSTHMVPTMFHRLLALPEDVRRSYDVSSLKFAVHAAAPCPVEDKRAMLDWWGPVIYEYYSSTEGGGAAVNPHEWLEHPGTVGRAWEGAEVKILDEDGAPVPAGAVGAVWIRNDDPFVYHNDPEKTATAWRDGFFTAGDMGFLDEDGWLYLADRRSDLIISGGVNIYPAEIEAALLAHPAVSDAGVIGLPDPEWGSTVHAVVELTAGTDPGDRLSHELLDFCERRLARYKCPRSLEFRSLPRTPTGKLSHSALRKTILESRAQR
ncbi:AMP-binding protein [Saccharopolyspora sp. NPDC050642]|uniref:AMP-binding protein n=1 Tax=Saccharopolyspora sp. NPDC050642 TaxID=3157099 RepID=UPI0033C914AA